MHKHHITADCGRGNSIGYRNRGCVTQEFHAFLNYRAGAIHPISGLGSAGYQSDLNALGATFPANTKEILDAGGWESAERLQRATGILAVRSNGRIAGRLGEKGPPLRHS
ncbi:hypothetical protein StoSoilB22_12910 [Arthrobacter sp. StoSoilB22]|nr:hypothetical protein StoSoilB22_12910 [Arthrobacter sp. StoSoilB22]